ncbi:MAG: FAD binding domain-containing protein, partial [Pirellulales bacterium]
MRDHLVFYINGIRQAVGGHDAGRTLSDYLRMGCGATGANRLTGTKVACAEGDCGACTVLVGRLTADGRALEYVPIDACIAFVYQLDRTHIVTVEGIAADGKLSPVQLAMVTCHGSQCGFCTPGFVMALHGLVETERGADDKRQLADEELRLGLSGNLCRCTGYAQIMEAGAAIEPGKVVRMKSQFDAAAIVKDLASLRSGPVHVNPPVAAESNGRVVESLHEIFLPTTLEELLAQRAARPKSTLVSGATDVGVQVNHRKLAPMSVITTQSVSELQRLEIVDGELIVGAAVRWAQFAEFIADRVPEYKAVLDRFGSPQIRQMGTLVGNLANASPIADSIPFHYVAESTIELASVDGRRKVPIEKFYRGYKQLD